MSAVLLPMGDPSDLAAVTMRLELARRRALRATLLAGLIWSGLAAALVLLVLEGVRVLAPQAWSSAGLPAIAFRPAALAAAAVFVAGAAVALVVASLRTPDIAAMARIAEQRFTLQERLSTALEARARVGAHPPPTVVRALLRDAAGQSGAIDPRRLIAMRIPRAAWLFPAVIALLAVVEFAPPAPLTVSVARTDAVPEAFLDLSEQTAIADLLMAVANQINRDERFRDDPMAGALARTLTSLGDTLRATPGMERAALSARLQELLRQAETTMGTGGLQVADAGPSPLEALAAAVRGIDTSRFQPQSELALAPDAARPSPDGGPAADLAQRQAAAGGNDGSPDQPAGDSPADPRAGTPAAGLADAGAAPDAPFDYYEAAQLAAEQEPAEPPAEMAGEVAGAADNAGRGESQLAGRGTQPLGDEAPWEAATVALGEELLLAYDRPDEGRRIRLELPPEARLATLAGDNLPPSADGHRPTAEAEVNHAAVAADRRDIVRRYFMPAGEPALP